MSFDEKYRALDALGVERLLRIRFNEQLRTMSAQDFVDDIFVTALGVRYVVLGDDFRFGADREGDIGLIRERGRHHGFEAGSMPTVTVQGERVSSTRIREALARADFAAADVMLGRPYSITGRVVYGKQLGRRLGIPTANIELRRLRAPVAGVFAVEVSGAGLRAVQGVANVGVRPTIGDSIKANLEVHLLDRSVDLYGRRITVTFRHKLREEQKFDSLDELRQHIEQDVCEARAWFMQA